MKTVTQKEKRIKRHRRVRAQIRGTKNCPRLSVYRSGKHVFLQLIDDDAQKTIVGFSDKEVSAKKMDKSQRAFASGKLIAEKAKENKIKKIVFDRGGYRYHGRIQKVAEGAREGGLEF